MVKLAHHIMVAREFGPEAGLDVYLNTPIVRQHQNYRTITAKRTAKTKLATYCKIFADQLNTPEEFIGRGRGRPRKNPVVVEVEAPAAPDMADLFAQFQAFISGQAVEVEEEPVIEAPVARKTTEVRGKRVNMPVTCITAGDAWAALNTDGKFPAPRDAGKPATNGQLYRLNTAGMLRIA